MNRLQITTTGVWLAFLAAACSSESPGSSNSGVGGNSAASSTGGSQGDTGGTKATTGGSSATTGPTQTGGNSAAAGGTSSVAATGGKSAGGTSSNATGGKSTASTAGGAIGTGGKSSAGGAIGTGGKSTAGGAIGTGGKSTAGGAAATGGTSSVGQGGTAVALGGSAAAGGTSAVTSGGANTGGTNAAGTTSVSAPQVITSDQTTKWKTGTYTEVTSGTADITVGTSGGQSYVGFGGTFNEVGWDVMKSLGEADRTAVMKALFSADAGINFAWGRIPIGASDYGLTWYTLDDTANDTSMSKFSVEHDKANLIPFINAALEVKSDIKFWGSPWTPPAWMKTNNALDASTSDANMKSDDTTLTAFALYLEKFVQEYGKLSPPIKISAVVPQNEPGYGNPYPSCYWDSATFVKFIGKFLGPLFAKDSISTDIWAGTMSAPSDGDIAVAAWNDSSAKTYLKGSGLQWNTFDKCSALKSKGLLVMTEHKCGNYSFNTSTPKGDISWSSSQRTSTPANDYNYGIETWYLIRDWLQAGVHSYNAWNMVLDTNGLNNSTGTKWPQNSLIVVDKGAKKYTLTPAYYVFRHISQYLKLPATLINTSGDYLAFKNSDGSYVVAVYNKGSAKNMIVSVNNKKLQFAAPGNGWATINVAP
jgi:glucosylceramidase